MQSHGVDKAYDMFAEKIIQALESGIAPWRKGWDGPISTPRNLKTGRAYTGANLVFLWMSQIVSDYNTPHWIGFQQANDLGYRIRKGERGTPIVIYHEYALKDKTSGAELRDDRNHPLTRRYAKMVYVWNATQLETVDGTPLDHSDALPDDFVQRDFEAMLTAWKEPPTIVHRGSLAAYYRPATDTVVLPLPEHFHSSEEYCVTKAHECIHATGHPNRLGRLSLDATTSAEAYSKEELIAEIGAMLLCNQTNVIYSFENSAAYVDGWLKTLNKDRGMIRPAVQSAAEAVALILGQ